MLRGLALASWSPDQPRQRRLAGTSDNEFKKVRFQRFLLAIEEVSVTFRIGYFQ
jgi:hypothetical protein